MKMFLVGMAKKESSYYSKLKKTKEYLDKLDKDKRRYCTLH